MEANCTGSLIDTGDASRAGAVDRFIAFIRELNELLQKEADLSPANLTVTERIGQLSRLLRLPYLAEEVQAVLNHAYIRMNQLSLQEKLSEAEFLVELRNAEHMCQTEGTVMDMMTRLPSWNVYRALVSQELAMLRPFIPEERQAEKSPIVFVGSGPLPISPIILHLFGDVEVICLEMNAVAYEASCSLLAHFGLQNKVSVVLVNGADYDYSPYSYIFMASLVRNKREVLERIRRTSANPLVAVRTAEGMKQLMYEAIDESELDRHQWRIVGRTSPEQGLVINSTLFVEHEAVNR
ncbi:nicotianamine synthase-like protein [Paenibacillus cellulosilyticus]|uniref:Nicotianamine synthase-like protein n=1 Tax=Paenibacillus cellulosilyticus TaxID=375489 RepID=A0A2V2YZK0_9BACL|nr:nicotianamine synthase family protein [Paenibacillus cellulosilyticus]PWV99344.1 nicotianamine synthase-like protein [Paenibacillus cellulosilyticus]QKS45108.1 nicotianamine synthase [Paenibacillus cellulosilyticus]